MISHTVVIDINRGPFIIIDLKKVSRRPERFEHNHMLRTETPSRPDLPFACMAASTSGAYLGGSWFDGAPK